jgi:hypothetical protein
MAMQLSNATFEVFTTLEIQVEVFWVVKMKAAWTSEALIYYHYTTLPGVTTQKTVTCAFLVLFFAQTRHLYTF